MKKPLFLLLAGFACPLGASESPSSATPDAKRLAEAAPFYDHLIRRGPAVRAPVPAPTKVARREPARKLASKMPIVSPASGRDARMPIQTPDASVDHKLIVKTPDVASVK
jgi:hypothetical protein